MPMKVSVGRQKLRYSSRKIVSSVTGTTIFMSSIARSMDYCREAGARALMLQVVKGPAQPGVGPGPPVSA